MIPELLLILLLQIGIDFFFFWLREDCRLLRNFFRSKGTHWWNNLPSHISLHSRVTIFTLRSKRYTIY